MSRSSRIVEATQFIATAKGRPRLRLSDAEGIAARHANQLANYSAAHPDHAMPLEPAPRLADRLRHAAEVQEAKDAKCKLCYAATEALDLEALGLTKQYAALPMLTGSDWRTHFVGNNTTKSADWVLLLPPPASMKETLDLNDPQLRLLMQRLLAVLADIREHQACSQARSVAPRPLQLAPVALVSRAVTHFTPKPAVRRHLGGFLTGIGISSLVGALLYILTG
jgi:hypothetical protein